MWKLNTLRQGYSPMSNTAKIIEYSINQTDWVFHFNILLAVMLYVIPVNKSTFVRNLFRTGTVPLSKCVHYSLKFSTCNLHLDIKFAQDTCINPRNFCDLWFSDPYRWIHFMRTNALINLLKLLSILFCKSIQALSSSKRLT